MKPDWATWPDEPDAAYIAREVAKCRASPHYFVKNYCSIYAAADRPPDDEAESDPLTAGGKWVQFELWPSQEWPFQVIHTKRKSIHLKARQIGMTWSALAYVLWMLIFLDQTTALLFSRGDREALDLMKRLKEMTRRLPPWLLPLGLFDRKGRLTGSSGHMWQWPDGGRAMAFPASAGDSYQASIAVIDEADLVPDLNKLLASVKATIDNGGKLVMVSKSQKSKPDSPFKRIFRAAMQGENGFEPVFLPWWAHPGRTLAWYRDQVKFSMSTTFALDFVKGEYPQCVAAETRVSTEKGILPIAESLDAKETESGPVVSATIQPASQIWKLTTHGGRELRGTHDHPVMTTDGFVHLSRLEPGMAIELRPPRFAESVHVERWNPFPGVESSVAVTPLWGRYIGYFMGDGCWYKNGIEIVCDAKDADVVKDVIGLTVELIGVPNIKKHRKAKCLSVRIHRGAIREAFVRLGLIHEKSRHYWSRCVGVPHCIWKSPKPVVKEFLSGLFESDGSAAVEIGFSTNKNQFARDVQLLLLGFGVNSHIRERIGTGGSRKKYKWWSLELNKADAEAFVREIGFVGERKRSQADEVIRDRGARSIRKQSMMDSVKTVERDGFEETYDFTIGSAHVFSANGILTHNTWEEAIEANQLDKRFPESVLGLVFKDAVDLCRGGGDLPAAEWENPKWSEGSDLPKMLSAPCPMIPGLRVYQLPKSGRSITIGCDPAQGTPQSNDSALVGIDDDNGEEVFHIRGKINPRTIGRFSAAMCDWYRKPPGARATVVIERNNHGHAVISWWRDNVETHDFDASMWLDADGERGWVQTGAKKELMYHRAADKVGRKQCIIHSPDLYGQIASIEASTLEAPADTQLLDDSAVAWGLALAVSSMKKRTNWMSLEV